MAKSADPRAFAPVPSVPTRRRWPHRRSRVERSLVVAPSQSRATRPTIIRVAAVTGDDVRAAAELCERILEPALGADWNVPVPDLEFTVATVVAHAAESPLWYSVDMWSGRENAAFEVKVLRRRLELSSVDQPGGGLARAGGRCRRRSRRDAGLPSLRFAGPLGVRGDGVRRAACARGRRGSRARGFLHPRGPPCRGRAGTAVPLARRGTRR